MKYKIISISLLFSVILLSGCASTGNPFTHEVRLSNASKGAGVCGAVGALIGGLAGQSLSTAAIGGATGAVLCGGIGYYYDQQEKTLKEKLDKTGVSVMREGDTIRLVMPGSILFNSNIDQVHYSFYPVLNSIYEVLMEYDKTVIVIQGHTDNQGTEDYNLKLSKRRAVSVADYLVYKGVDSKRLLPMAFGESFPVNDNATAYERRLNRRVELLIKTR